MVYIKVKITVWKSIVWHTLAWLSMLCKTFALFSFAIRLEIISIFLDKSTRTFDGYFVPSTNHLKCTWVLKEICNNSTRVHTYYSLFQNSLIFPQKVTAIFGFYGLKFNFGIRFKILSFWHNSNLQLNAGLGAIFF